MNEKNAIEQYIDNINENILPFIDYEKLHTSYKTDMVYAKGILNLLHEAMVKAYGADRLDWRDGNDGYVVIPGVVRNMKNGNICLALLDLDLNSSGEHWGTDFLCKYGIITQGENEEQDKQITELVHKFYVPYDYCYTAVIPCDHHVDESTLPKELKSVINDFHKYKVDLTNSPGIPDENSKKPSLLEGVREAEKEIQEKDNEKEKQSTNKKSKPEL